MKNIIIYILMSTTLASLFWSAFKFQEVKTFNFLLLTAFLFAIEYLLASLLTVKK